VYKQIDDICRIQQKEFLTLKEAAFLLNISPLTLRRWILSGRICSIKTGKKHCIKKSDLLQIWMNNTNKFSKFDNGKG
jgi:excisionase family DNA binding protein